MVAGCAARLGRDEAALSTVATWAAPLATLFAVGSVVGFASWIVPRNRRLTHLAGSAGVICLIAATAAWIDRWRVAGHLPLFGTYESALSLAVAVLANALVARWAMRDEGSPWPVASAIAAALLAHGMRFDPAVYALTISERSLGSQAR